MAATGSSLIAAAASSSSRAAIPARRPRTAPAATASIPSSSRSSCPPLRASHARALRSRVIAGAAAAMQPTPVSRVSTVVDVDLGDRSYPIYIGPSLLDEPELLQRHVIGKRVLVVTNTTVAPLYLEKVTWALTHNNPNVSVESVILPDGEKYKDMDTLMKVFDKAVESRFDRRCTFVALGGGVIGDMCGFAAAAFLRGVNFIQIPTTLMAQVDSSVGGKTGINHPLGKNLIGAFYQPQCVLIDTETLNTLPDRELASGIGEVVKYGLIRDAPFFEWQEKNMSALLASCIQQSSLKLTGVCRSIAGVRRSFTGVRRSITGVRRSIAGVLSEDCRSSPEHRRSFTKVSPEFCRQQTRDGGELVPIPPNSEG